jgi:hypothetical protein
MNRRGIACHTLWIAALGVAIVCPGGCGGSGQPKTIPITGRVTINGQPPGEVGKLFFTPTEAASGYNKRPASGGFTADGNYRVMSWEPDDGLVPGHYTVSISPGDLNTTKIPAKYQLSSTSGLEVDVPVDEDKVEFDVNIVTQ